MKVIAENILEKIAYVDKAGIDTKNMDMFSEVKKLMLQSVCDPNDLVAGMEDWITFQFLLFLTPEPDMRRITMLLNFLLSASVFCTQA